MCWLRTKSASQARRVFEKPSPDTKRTSIYPGRLLCPTTVKTLRHGVAIKPFEHEIVHATADKQANAFTALYNAAAGRLHIHSSFEKLLAEMGTLEYRIVNNSTGKGGQQAPRFEAAKGGCQDDHVYSLAWAVYSLRDVELNPYEINGIHCHATGPAIKICLINDGEMLPPCAELCRSMITAHNLYKSYLSRGSTNPLAFDEFIQAKLKNIGAHALSR
jgi:hypothetical protein